MRKINDLSIRMGLDALYYSGVHRLMAPVTAGRGTIFVLHRVRPAPSRDDFAPNRALEVTPEFLDETLTLLRRRGIDIVNLDESIDRLRKESKGRFAVFTFDDGYCDNLDIALPIFEAHNAPLTIYVATGLIDGTADIWWLTLEAALARLDAIRLRIGDRIFDMRTRNAAEKQAAWTAVYWPLRDVSIAQRQAAVNDLAQQGGVNAAKICSDVGMRREQLRAAADHRLVTLGAHTVHHFPLSALNDKEAHYEILEGRHWLETQIGQPVNHFAYPFGDHSSTGPRDIALARELGFRTAVTTRRGPLFAEHALHLHCLPRVSLNGNFQSMRYVDLFLSGAPFALWKHARKLNAA